MEKKGDILNQLAIISDLIENLNMSVESKTLIFTLNDKEFIDMFALFQKKHGEKYDIPNNSFSIKIGDIDILFNKNNA
jgi:hypothetical protein